MWIYSINIDIYTFILSYLYKITDANIQNLDQIIDNNNLNLILSKIKS
jgi:hypothetical protein